MYNILASFNAISETKKPATLKESRSVASRKKVTECPTDMGMESAPTGNAPISFSGEPEAIAAMIKALGQIEQGGAGPQVAMSKPMAIGGIDDIPGPEMDDEPEGPEMGGGMPDISQMSDEQIAEWENEPDEDYRDHNHMTKELSGGINRQKKMYAKSQDGDNAMAVESIKARLHKALEEAKGKPDFLDADKDGNKKEPMKKALKDKTKGKVDELSPGTLKSYAKKASSSSHPNSSSNLSSRAAYDLAQDDSPNSKAGEKDDAKSARRSKYVGKAIDKMTAPQKKK